MKPPQDGDGRLKRTGSFLFFCTFIFIPEISNFNFPEFCFCCMHLFFFCFLGKILTASACIITAVIGPEVLSSSWAIAQLGWVGGPTAIFLFSFVTYYTSTRLTACCRAGDQVAKQYTYMDAVRAKLGKYS